MMLQSSHSNRAEVLKGSTTPAQVAGRAVRVTECLGCYPNWGGAPQVKAKQTKKEFFQQNEKNHPNLGVVGGGGRGGYVNCIEFLNKISFPRFFFS